MGLPLLFLLLAGPVGTQSAAPPPPKPRLVCRETEQETGSHIRTGRRCKTEEEWQREDAENGRTPATMRVTEGQGDALTKQRPP